jgi:UDP-3-O-[3-hydroxymyristoyl] glucosamine N-acyltransferase
MIKLIGFPEATVTIDMSGCIRMDGHSVDTIHPDDFFAGKYDAHDIFIVTVMRELELRQQIIRELNVRGLSRATFVHSTAIVDPSAVIKPGTFVGPFASVFCQSHIGYDVIVGPYSMVSHKVSIGDGTLIHPGTMIAGTASIGNNCTMGLRSTVLDQVAICDDVSIAGGALVNKDITISGCYVGAPARKIARETDFLALDNLQVK